MSTTFEDAPDLDLDEIAQYVFTKPPGEPKTIDLRLTEESTRSGDAHGTIIQMFTDIALIGCSILWGESVNITNLTREQFHLLQKYMNSMGVSLVIKCNEDSADPWETVESGGEIHFLRIAIEWL